MRARVALAAAGDLPGGFDDHGRRQAQRDGRYQGGQARLVRCPGRRADPLEVTYTAVGKGLYELSVPPGGILDEFDVSIEAKGSDVRLLELSSSRRGGPARPAPPIYVGLPAAAFGQPVRLDFQGIALIHRLGESTWLGPFSVLVFGLMVGLVVRAASVPRFDLWMVLLTVGTFAGAYPLMYFAQEYIARRSGGPDLGRVRPDGHRGNRGQPPRRVAGARRGALAGDGDPRGHPHRGRLAGPPGHPAHSRAARLLHRRDAAPGQDPCRGDHSPGRRAGDPDGTRGTHMTPVAFVGRGVEPPFPRL